MRRNPASRVVTACLAPRDDSLKVLNRKRQSDGLIKRNPPIPHSRSRRHQITVVRAAGEGSTCRRTHDRCRTLSCWKICKYRTNAPHPSLDLNNHSDSLPFKRDPFLLLFLLQIRKRKPIRRPDLQLAGSDSKTGNKKDALPKKKPLKQGCKQNRHRGHFRRHRASCKGLAGP